MISSTRRAVVLLLATFVLGGAVGAAAMAYGSRTSSPRITSSRLIESRAREGRPCRPSSLMATVAAVSQRLLEAWNGELEADGRRHSPNEPQVRVVISLRSHGASVAPRVASPATACSRTRPDPRISLRIAAAGCTPLLARCHRP